MSCFRTYKNDVIACFRSIASQIWFVICNNIGYIFGFEKTDKLVFGIGKFTFCFGYKYSYISEIQNKARILEKLKKNVKQQQKNVGGVPIGSSV